MNQLTEEMHNFGRNMDESRCRSDVSDPLRNTSIAEHEWCHTPFVFKAFFQFKFLLTKMYHFRFQFPLQLQKIEKNMLVYRTIYHIIICVGLQ